jgi:hypothetical protein
MHDLGVCFAEGGMKWEHVTRGCMKHEMWHFYDLRQSALCICCFLGPVLSVFSRRLPTRPTSP